MALLVAAMLSADLAKADDFDEVYNFISGNAVNRTLSRSSNGALPGGDVVYEFQRDITICNLTRAKNRLAYDAIYVIKQRNWDVKDGEKSGPPRVEDRIIAIRHELGSRRSTGEILGYAHILTSTSENFGGTSLSLRVRLKGEKLEVEITTPRYDDYFATGGTFYPGAQLINETWSVEDGKLVIESHSTAYKVDPESGEREAIEDKQPSERDVETARLPLN